MKKRFSVAEQIVAVVKRAELGSAYGGGDSQGWDQRADLLSMEEAIRWHGDRSGSADETTQEENSRLKQLVADLSLDKTMLQGCARKKF